MLMKILFIINSLRSGGKERRLISLVEGLLNYDDVEIQMVILSKEIHYKSILKTGIKIHTLARDIRKDFMIIPKFNKILKQFKPTITHCWDNIAAIHFAPVCNLRGIPFINSMITAAPVTAKFTKRYFSYAISYPFSDVILSNSQAGLDNLYVPLRKQKVIYNGFDFNRIKKIKDKESIYKKFGIDREKPIIGMVASFIVKKDQLTLLRAALLCNGMYSYVLIGEGNKLEEMKKIVEKEAIKNVYFLGKQQDVESIVNIFDVGVLLSNPSEHGEGISNAIIEYMVLEKPVIASKGGGTAELVVDGETAFLIDPKNPEQLAEKIKYLTTNKDEAVNMGKTGRKRIEDFFSIDKMVSDTYKLYLNNIKN